MKLSEIITGTPATLMDILDARSMRADRQKELLNTPGASCLISFSLNIAGEFKSFPLALAAFEEGLDQIRKKIPEDCLLLFEESRKNTGPESFFLLKSDPVLIKKQMTAIEETHPLGRLFDLDVLGADGLSLSRTALGLPPRTCLICGENAKGCARNRSHSIELVLWRTAQLLDDFFRNRAADTAASCAVRALLYEVSTTPKPGLVDRNNSGSHKDMDFFTFLDSSAALIPWFRDFFCLGWNHGSESDSQLFSRLRFAGQQAEARMFAATGGVNTHKGLIFAFAILCGALGKASAGACGSDTSGPDGGSDASRQADTCGPATSTHDSCSHRKPAAFATPLRSETVLDICKRLGACSLNDFEPGHVKSGAVSAAPGIPASPEASSTSLPPKTAGERCHESYGLSGARGEAAAGFPSALSYGLPVLKHWLRAGLSLNDAAAMALLSMIGTVEDTNMIHRGGRTLALESRHEAAELMGELTLHPNRETNGLSRKMPQTELPASIKEKLTALDASYIQRNLSPGGCADLLAVSLMFYFLETSGMITPL